MSTLKHSQIELDDASIHVVETGVGLTQTVLFLHGWPEDWSLYKDILEIAGDTVHALAIDLPGIGKSLTKGAAPSTKRDIADCVHRLVKAKGLKNITLVGHDVGGQVVFAYLTQWPEELERAAILNVAVPGVEPWGEVIRNPYIWHFGFHAVPNLPEVLVAGNERAYFDYFYNAISAHPQKIDEEIREAFTRAYSTPLSLTTGFNWYRAFAQDAKDNASHVIQTETPVLYIRGDKEGGTIGVYANGFRKAGIRNLQETIVLDSGHFAPVEQPVEVWDAIAKFIKS